MKITEPLEIERKYLIRKPSDREIADLDCRSITEITQVYLTETKEGVSRRIRKRGNDREGYLYYYTEKEHISSSVRIERESIIPEEEFASLMEEADPKRHPIMKTRYCFMFEDRMYEMDIFPFSEEYAFLEIELEDPEDIPKKLPPLDIIRDVTEEKKFTNKAIARTGRMPV
ncbi:MAG: hypothetical protein HUJ76_00615 [Parasporobacterium sp.]|nr:hypothetical protein [Parasporobacterium sp.]